MKKERKEFEKGVFVDVDVCSRCKDEWVDEKGYDELYRLFRRKTFRIGGSLAVRIPKELADLVGLKEGAEVRFALQDDKIVIEPVTSQ
jgi:AbrB family looped-hinge helix DNA binding protein